DRKPCRSAAVDDDCIRLPCCETHRGPSLRWNSAGADREESNLSRQDAHLFTAVRLKTTRSVRLTPQFSSKDVTTIAAKPYPKSACQLQRSLGTRVASGIPAQSRQSL